VWVHTFYWYSYNDCCTWKCRFSKTLVELQIFFVGGPQSHIIVSLEKHSFDFQMKGFVMSTPT